MSLSHLLLAASLATSPSPVPSDADMVASTLYMQSLVSELRASKSARSRAVAESFSTDGSSEAAMQQAAEDAPADVLVQMLWSTRHENRTSAQALAWARAEPGNGLAWVPALDSRQADVADLDEAISRIAEAQTYDDHLVDAWETYRRAFASRPMPAPMLASFHLTETPTRLDAATAREAAEAIMAMAHAAALPFRVLTLTRACNRAENRQASAARFEACARIGRGIMRSESSAATKMIGSGLVRRSGLENDGDREAKRALDWRMQAAGDLLRTGPGEIVGYFTDLASTGSETRAQELLMARHGVAADPPPGWHAGN
jgi:hypothetical protein